MLYNMLLMLIPIVYLVIWWKGAQVREMAVQAAKRACKQYQVQFLDDTVVRCGWKFIRDSHGHLIIERDFQFEFSPDGDSRYQGCVKAQAKHIQSVNLEAYPEPRYY